MVLRPVSLLDDDAFHSQHEIKMCIALQSSVRRLLAVGRKRRAELALTARAMERLHRSIGSNGIIVHANKSQCASEAGRRALLAARKDPQMLFYANAVAFAVVEEMGDCTVLSENVMDAEVKIKAPTHDELKVKVEQCVTLLRSRSLDAVIEDIDAVEGHFVAKLKFLNNPRSVAAAAVVNSALRRTFASIAMQRHLVIRFHAIRVLQAAAHARLDCHLISKMRRAVRYLATAVLPRVSPMSFWSQLGVDSIAVEILQAAIRRRLLYSIPRLAAENHERFVTDTPRCVHIDIVTHTSTLPLAVMDTGSADQHNDLESATHVHNLVSNSFPLRIARGMQIWEASCVLQTILIRNSRMSAVRRCQTTLRRLIIGLAHRLHFQRQRRAAIVICKALREIIQQSCKPGSTPLAAIRSLQYGTQLSLNGIDMVTSGSMFLCDARPSSGAPNTRRDSHGRSGPRMEALGSSRSNSNALADTVVSPGKLRPTRQRAVVGGVYDRPRAFRDVWSNALSALEKKHIEHISATLGMSMDDIPALSRTRDACHSSTGPSSSSKTRHAIRRSSRELPANLNLHDGTHDSHTASVSGAIPLAPPNHDTTLTSDQLANGMIATTSSTRPGSRTVSSDGLLGGTLALPPSNAMKLRTIVASNKRLWRAPCVSPILQMPVPPTAGTFDRVWSMYGRNDISAIPLPDPLAKKTQQHNDTPILSTAEGTTAQSPTDTSLRIGLTANFDRETPAMAAIRRVLEGKALQETDRECLGASGTAATSVVILSTLPDWVSERSALAADVAPYLRQAAAAVNMDCSYLDYGFGLVDASLGMSAAVPGVTPNTKIQSELDAMHEHIRGGGSTLIVLLIGDRVGSCVPPDAIAEDVMKPMLASTGNTTSCSSASTASDAVNACQLLLPGWKLECNAGPASVYTINHDYNGTVTTGDETVDIATDDADTDVAAEPFHIQEGVRAPTLLDAELEPAGAHAKLRERVRSSVVDAATAALDKLKQQPQAARARNHGELLHGLTNVVDVATRSQLERLTNAAVDAGSHGNVSLIAIRRKIKMPHDSKMPVPSGNGQASANVRLRAVYSDDARDGAEINDRSLSLKAMSNVNAKLKAWETSKGVSASSFQAQSRVPLDDGTSTSGSARAGDAAAERVNVVMDVETEWSSQGVCVENNGEYLRSFADRICSAGLNLIGDTIKTSQQKPWALLDSDPATAWLIPEVTCHCHEVMKQHPRAKITSRDYELTLARRYIDDPDADQPLVFHGPPEAGLSSLAAGITRYLFQGVTGESRWEDDGWGEKFVEKPHWGMPEDRIVAIRFAGLTMRSLSVSSVLHSIAAQIRALVALDKTDSDDRLAGSGATRQRRLGESGWDATTLDAFAESAGREFPRGTPQRWEPMPPHAHVDGSHHTQAAAADLDQAMRLVARLDRQLVIIIDGVDCLIANDDDSQDILFNPSTPQSMWWLPPSLPPGVHVIVTITDPVVPFLPHNIPDANIISTPTMIHRGSMEAWLSERGRRVQKGQLEALVATAKECCSEDTGAFISVALAAALHWPASWSQERVVEHLTGQHHGQHHGEHRVGHEPGGSVNTPATIIDAATAHWIAMLSHAHGRVIVYATLGFLCCSTIGFTQQELEDVLSLDDDVLQTVYAGWSKPPNPRRIPHLLVKRVADDLVSSGIVHRVFVGPGRQAVLSIKPNGRHPIRKAIEEIVLGDWAVRLDYNAPLAVSVSAMNTTGSAQHHASALPSTGSQVAVQTSGTDSSASGSDGGVRRDSSGAVATTTMAIGWYSRHSMLADYYTGRWSEGRPFRGREGGLLREHGIDPQSTWRSTLVLNDRKVYELCRQLRRIGAWRRLWAFARELAAVEATLSGPPWPEWERFTVPFVHTARVVALRTALAIRSVHGDTALLKSMSVPSSPSSSAAQSQQSSRQGKARHGPQGKNENDSLTIVDPSLSDGGSTVTGGGGLIGGLIGDECAPPHHVAPQRMSTNGLPRTATAQGNNRLAIHAESVFKKLGPRKPLEPMPGAAAAAVPVAPTDSNAAAGGESINERDGEHDDRGNGDAGAGDAMCRLDAWPAIRRPNVLLQAIEHRKRGEHAGTVRLLTNYNEAADTETDPQSEDQDARTAAVEEAVRKIDLRSIMGCGLAALGRSADATVLLDRVVLRSNELSKASDRPEAQIVLARSLACSGVAMHRQVGKRRQALARLLEMERIFKSITSHVSLRSVNDHAATGSTPSSVGEARRQRPLLDDAFALDLASGFLSLALLTQTSTSIDQDNLLERIQWGIDLKRHAIGANAIDIDLTTIVVARHLTKPTPELIPPRVAEAALQLAQAGGTGLLNHLQEPHSAADHLNNLLTARIAVARALEALGDVVAAGDELDEAVAAADGGTSADKARCQHEFAAFVRRQRLAARRRVRGDKLGVTSESVTSQRKALRFWLRWSQTTSLTAPP